MTTVTAEVGKRGTPAWCLDPRVWFNCPDCGDGLYWSDTDPGVVLVCGNRQCSAVCMEVSVWRAQQHREHLGVDRAVSAAGWPRPVLQGRPVPYLVPVTAGWPWWSLTHGDRLLRCQHHWCCQMCGLALEAQAWVLVDPQGGVQSDSAMHERCVRLASSACPYLAGAGRPLRLTSVVRADIRGDGQPLTARRAPWRQRWEVAVHRAAGPDITVGPPRF